MPAAPGHPVEGTKDRDEFSRLSGGARSIGGSSGPLVESRGKRSGGCQTGPLVDETTRSSVDLPLRG